MTAQPFDWTNNLTFLLCASLQNWGSCVSSTMLFPLQYFFLILIFYITQYYMQFWKWTSNIIAIKIYIIVTAFL